MVRYGLATPGLNWPRSGNRTDVRFYDIISDNGHGFFRSRAHCYVWTNIGGKLKTLGGGCDGVGDYAAVSPMCILALVLMRGKKLLKERRNVAVGKRVGYDRHRLSDDRGSCSNREAPDCANNGALERFIGVGVID